MEIDFKKFDHTFDPSLLIRDVQVLEASAWISHYRKENFEGNWAVLPLRSVGGHPEVIFAAPAGNNPDFYQNTEYLEKSGNLLAVINWFQCQVNAARLLRLDAGAKILEHTDPMAHGDDIEWRIHIPVITNELVEFVVNKSRLNMQPGEIWYADFNKPHFVNNHSKQDRIHLVLDCKPNAWLKSKIFDE